MHTYSRLGFAVSLALVITACSSSTSPTPGPGSGTGTITGTVSSSVGGGLSGVSVQVTPGTGSALPAVTTNANGQYTVTNVPVGGGAIAVSGLPSTCTPPTTDGYVGVTSGGTLTVNLVATCTATNSLVVIISGAQGVMPSATVTGPGGYSKTVSASVNVLSGLATGQYTVTTPSGTTSVPSPIVNTNYTGTVVGSPANVSSAVVDTVHVTYAADGTGALWFDAGYGATASQLGSTGTITPADSCNDGDYGAPFAFDANGNLWMGPVGYAPNGGATVPALIEFTPGQLGIECDVNLPNIVITGSFLANVSTTSIAFDSHGTLWLATTPNASAPPVIYGYSAAQLKASGSPTPTYAISATSANGGPGILTLPQWMAFDAGGDLWVSDQEGQVLEYTPSQLASSGSPTPAMLATTGTATDFPLFLAFDAQGNLWIVDPNYGVGSPSFVSEFSKSELAGLSGNSSPAAVSTLTASSSTTNWNAMAFDNGGNLWMLTEPTDASVLVRYPAANIGPGGSGKSDITVTASVPADFGQWIAFNPTPTGLPLVGSRVAHAPAPRQLQRRR